MTDIGLPVLSAAMFETGLRIDRYVASIVANREAFRANLVRSGQAFTRDDLDGFRTRPRTLRVAALADETRHATVRDLPLLGRLSMETRKVELRIFRTTTDPDVAAALAPASNPTPDLVLAFYDEDMTRLGVIVDGLPELLRLQRERGQRWVEAHPEVVDSALPVTQMTPLTRRRFEQACHTLSADESLSWSRALVSAVRDISAGPRPPAP